MKIETKPTTDRTLKEKTFQCIKGLSWDVYRTEDGTWTCESRHNLIPDGSFMRLLSVSAPTSSIANLAFLKEHVQLMEQEMEDEMKFFSESLVESLCDTDKPKK